MASASIRPFKPTDEKYARFLIGKANMQQLATANMQADMNPFVLAIWVALSSALVQYMKWWPDPQTFGWLAYLRPLPAFACMFLPIIFSIDWLNRNDIEEVTQEVLKARDLWNIERHYSMSPGSGFWILEYDDRPVGLIAIDASEPVNEDADGQSPSSSANKSFETATIRHFYVEEPYPQSGVQEDLLDHALEHCFKGDAVKRVKAVESQLVPYIQKVLKNKGFVFEKNLKTVGVFRWKLSSSVLERSAWKKQK